MTTENRELTPRDRQEADLKERREYDAKVQAAHAPTANKNAEYFAKQERIAEQIAKQNKYNAENQPKPKPQADVIAEAEARYPHRKVGSPRDRLPC
jgi:hypothetical protein